MNAQATQVTEFHSKDKIANKQRNWKQWEMSKRGDIFHRKGWNKEILMQENRKVRNASIKSGKLFEVYVCQCINCFPCNYNVWVTNFAEYFSNELDFLGGRQTSMKRKSNFSYSVYPNKKENPVKIV